MSKDFNDIENDDIDDTPEEEDFASLFESYSDTANQDLAPGSQISGRIISIGEDTVFVDTGGKIDGYVDSAELLDENGEMPYQVGDRIELYIVAVNESEIKLSRALSGIGGLRMLEEAHANKIPVEGKVTQTCKGGFNVEVMHRRAFCPVSQMDLKFVETPEDYVGQTLHFLIMQVEENGRNIVVSRRNLLQIEQEKSAKAFYQKVDIGSVLDGRVTRITPYGVFVELAPGVEGMIHISELSWSRIENPGEIVSIDDVITAKIMDIKGGDAPSQKKISLSVKQLEGDPWNTVGQRFESGQKIMGKVVRCVKFGVFVEIAPGIEGLVHISEMSYIKRVINPEDMVSLGQTVSVMIKEVDPDKRRISLSMRDAEGDPWLDVAEKYPVGQSVAGLIEKKENFGYFVKLEPGVTGLLPKSNINKAAQPQLIEKLKEGDTINVIVEKVQAADRKISLAASDSADEGNWKSFVNDGQASMSPLADKLRKAMAAKKE